MTRFVGLCFQHMNDIAGCLYEAPEQFEPIFNGREVKGKTYTIVEEWCFGYMKGRSLDDWSALPEALRPSLEAIALHGIERTSQWLRKCHLFNLNRVLLSFSLRHWRFTSTGCR